MKMRQGFVSNSSSSSFVIPRDVLSKRQVNKIENHIHFSNGMDTEYEENGETWCNHQGDAWSITVDDDEVSGYTSMDNFDMRWFLTQIDVDEDDIEWVY